MENKGEQIITYAVVERGMENKGKLWQKHDAAIEDAVVGKKAHLQMKQH